MEYDPPTCHIRYMTSKPKRPRDASQLAKAMVDIATGQAEDTDPDEGKDKAAQALGKKGGRARAKKTLLPATRQ